MNLANTVAGAVQYYRTTAALTKSALAKRAGVSDSMISDIERGARTPSLHTLELIARALECEPFELLAYEEVSS